MAQSHPRGARHRLRERPRQRSCPRRGPEGAARDVLAHRHPPHRVRPAHQRRPAPGSDHPPGPGLSPHPRPRRPSGTGARPWRPTPAGLRHHVRDTGPRAVRRTASVLDALVLLSGCGAPTSIVTIGEQTFTVEVARTPDAQRAGLSDRDDVPAGTGMLFPFDEPDLARSGWPAPGSRSTSLGSSTARSSRSRPCHRAISTS
ncbi:DUF192 domain-containing protein [Oerskovia turbata]|uniref:DUF192 domain-containing protein n=1 Tax=Oerskovia turbata TaxID=1713 RepID=A0A4V1N4F7_9CELL|nr:DUF192 domain-containing protein [Oerskovia turbata]RXR32006.1 DUF192 domain-containing protein [Oerskovia turbata]TGJ96929.1 hypothetical protein DLJ96_02470 [Actinotalea fermentans ATCC 43279 = JCM 9966 = DSM 3133]